jgi:hypothetical protein
MEKNHVADECKKAVQEWYKRNAISVVESDPTNGMYRLRYIFRDIALLHEKKVVLYGAGAVGKSYYEQLTHDGSCEIVAWADREKESVNLVSLIRPEELRQVEYDVLVIAVLKEDVARDMTKSLLEAGICQDERKIVWQKPLKIW